MVQHLLFANNASTRCHLAIGAGATVIPLQPGEGAKFPTPASGESFMVTLEDRRSGQVEICECTLRSGDSLTVIRAQEGTTAQDFAAGATVSNRLTAQTLTILMSSTGVEEAPADSKAYARRNEDWIETTTKAQADVLVGRVNVLEGEMNAVEAVNVTQAAELVRLEDIKVDEAPIDGKIYGRQGEAWIESVSRVTFNTFATAQDTRDDVQEAASAQEVTDRTTADTTLQNNINAEATTRNNADVLLQNAIDTETAARQNADTAIVNTHNTYVTTQDTRDDAQDAAIASKAPLASPVLTGNPQAPTPTLGDNDTSIATTAFTAAAIGAFSTSISTVYAPIASPTFTGDPKAPTPATADNDTSIATTAFVKAQGYLSDAPNDGLTYGRKNLAWATIVGGAVVSDTPPGGPLQVGQLWWESDSGDTFIWVVDAGGGQWVQQNGPSVPVIAIGDAPPASPLHGSMWWQSSTGRLYTFYNDGTSSAWVQISGPQQQTGAVKIFEGAYPSLVSDVTMPLPTNGYCFFELFLNGVTAAAAGGINIRFSWDNGATFPSAAGQYQYLTQAQGYTAPTTITAAGSTAASATIIGNWGTGAGKKAMAKVTFPLMPGNGYQTLDSLSDYWNGTTYYTYKAWNMSILAVGPPTNLRVIAAGGNISIDKVQLNGMR